MVVPSSPGDNSTGMNRTEAFRLHRNVNCRVSWFMTSRAFLVIIPFKAVKKDVVIPNIIPSHEGDPIIFSWSIPNTNPTAIHTHESITGIDTGFCSRGTEKNTTKKIVVDLAKGNPNMFEAQVVESEHADEGYSHQQDLFCIPSLHVDNSGV